MVYSKSSHLYFWSCVYIAMFCGTIQLAGGNDDAKRLYHDLLIQNKYNKLIRPVGNNTNKPLTVKMGIRLSQIIDVDELNQVMTTNVWLKQVYLATSSIHEMFSCELTSLGILSVDQNTFTKWNKNKTSKTLLPDFILDRGDVDSLSPWQLHLIDGHTFPHHVLRTWYCHFDIAMDTTSIEDMYKTLCLLHAGRQTQVELPLILIQVCTDLTLCMLSLMMSETPTAMSHLLQAVSSLHEAGHVHVMQGLLRLFLPQGPKYILKLQQEVTAMRVMISMDTHSHVDGASKVHTIKRYLSEHKDESIINTSSLRCREIDCLRAYYYVTIINFLKESCFSGEVNDTGTSVVKMEGDCLPLKTVSNDTNQAERQSESSEIDVEVECSKHDSCSAEKNKNGKEQNLAVTDSTPKCTSLSAEVKDVENAASASDKSGGEMPETSENSIDTSESVPVVCGENTQSSHPESETSVSHPLGGSKTTKSESDESQNVIPVSPEAAKSKEPALDGVKANTKDSGVSKSSVCQTVPVLNLNHYSITVSRLSQLSQGLLWDIQAKRFALTETLGYIHKAISQLLLSKNSPSADAGAAAGGESKPTEADEAKNSEKENSEPEADDGKKGDNFDENVSAAADEQIRDTASNVDSKVEKTNGDVSISVETDLKVDATACGSSSKNMISFDSEIHICHHHEMHVSHSEGHLCPSVLSHHFDQMLNIHVPHVGDVPVNSYQNDPDTDLKCSFFEVCSSCELLHKSRKILFEDEPRFHTRPEVGFKDMTNIINPAKYINVPDEWYSMPVDQKYFKRYITMAILKDEQEYVMGELKRGPDGTQSPFPSPLESVKTLLDLADHSSHISTMERQEFVQKVISWALNFAVTTQQKQTFVNLLQTHLEN